MTKWISYHIKIGSGYDTRSFNSSEEAIEAAKEKRDKHAEYNAKWGTKHTMTDANVSWNNATKVIVKQTFTEETICTITADHVK